MTETKYIGYYTHDCMDWHVFMTIHNGTVHVGNLFQSRRFYKHIGLTSPNFSHIVDIKTYWRTASQGNAEPEA